MAQQSWNFDLRSERSNISAQMPATASSSNTTAVPRFGGSHAEARRDTTKQILDAEYHKLKAKLGKLEKEEQSLWRKHHPNSASIDRDALFAEIEGRANTWDATTTVKKDYDTLKQCRAVREELADLATSLRDFAETEALPDLSDLPRTPSANCRPNQAHFWAVIVGIDTYDQPELALRGACEDAMAMYSYVTDQLQVEAEHVRVLLSPSTVLPNLRYDAATRSNILDTLYGHLRDNPNINAGDNILFYFSGHGARYPMPRSAFPSTGHSQETGEDQIEALCPADRSAHTPVYDISDREISIFLEELRDAKGNNITVILDCCHSGGAVRDVSNLGVSRAAWPLLVDPKGMLMTADADPRRRLTKRKAYCLDWDWDSSTSVLLAACEPQETAQESPTPTGAWRGHFTRALVQALSEGSEEKTYADVCKEVAKYMPRYRKFYLQKPMVIGDRKDSCLWYVESSKRVGERGVGRSAGLVKTLIRRFVSHDDRHSS